MSGKGGGDAERGAASVFAVAVVGVWGALVVVGVLVGEGVVARHRVEAAADLGALAAASWVVEGVDVACSRAGRVVGRMGARLDGCVVDGWEVEVVVSGGGSLFGAPGARARAGPAEG
ncbi:Rv3654c family TadE-like protein [Saccharothrix yanglingensis]|uniref:Rv3654c family TadE-like protein n=1 Tax=Saccharothrix yanglingensis TaxID=659496 RepID=UPI0027D2BAB3|nr:Rv3654c family TadE-like protein [Saccharothrix yanglingensis]